jgi:hypothetical protein
MNLKPREAQVSTLAARFPRAAPLHPYLLESSQINSLHAFTLVSDFPS